MTANKEEIVPISSEQASMLDHQCCMCGDYGIIQELFQCRICRFRSQHRYCSNLYPKPEPYKVCNWCLNQKEDSKEKSQNSSNSSASFKGNKEEDSSKNKKKGDNRGAAAGFNGGNQRDTNNLKLQLIKKNPIKKSKSSSPEKSSPITMRKRIITNACLEEKLRRTKSEEISKTKKGLITTHVFRNKVRRYKLLDEVSS